ncbi:hypothetical protein F4604DRAFT_1677297 [Suillus subluteus]|nr:hypothetical protein F4604DRAFT_1677297 [Suillus subluteus]
MTRGCFNEETPDVEGLIDTRKWPHSVILEKEGTNDWLVSVESAKWGTYLGTFSPVNHHDLVGWTIAVQYTWASIWGKEILFKPASFYFGVADSLAGVEENKGNEETLENGMVEDYRERMQQNLLGSKLSSQVRGYHEVNGPGSWPPTKHFQSPTSGPSHLMFMVAP